MSSKTIVLAGEVYISTGSIYTTVDALEAMKCIGVAYGLYSHAEEFRGQRVMLDEGGDGCKFHVRFLGPILFWLIATKDLWMALPVVGGLTRKPYSVMASPH